jgi:hypothetical protein
VKMHGSKAYYRFHAGDYRVVNGIENAVPLD